VTVDRHEHRRGAVVGERDGGVGEAVEGDAVPVEQRGVADDHVAAADP
jgi:hypothetical protein